MPRESNKDKLAERQDVTAPFLFDEDGDPTCLPVLESIRQHKYEHTGQRLVEDDALAFRLVELLCLGWGCKRIAREMCISVHTVRAAKQLLEKQGKLAPYKERFRALSEEIIEVGARQYLDALEKGKVPAAQIPVGIGIIFDKRALALGEPTSISQRDGPSQAEMSVEAINAYLAKLPSANPGPVDSQSAGNTPKTTESGGKCDIR